MQVYHFLNYPEKTRAHDVKSTYVCIYIYVHNYIVTYVFMFIFIFVLDIILSIHISYILYTYICLYIYICIYVRIPVCSFHHASDFLIYPSRWLAGHHHSSHWAVSTALFVLLSCARIHDEFFIQPLTHESYT